MTVCFSTPRFLSSRRITRASGHPQPDVSEISPQRRREGHVAALDHRREHAGIQLARRRREGSTRFPVPRQLISGIFFSLQVCARNSFAVTVSIASRIRSGFSSKRKSEFSGSDYLIRLPCIFASFLACRFYFAAICKRLCP